MAHMTLQDRLAFFFEKLRETVVQACEQSLAAHGLLSDRTMDLYPNSDEEDPEFSLSEVTVLATIPLL